MRLVAADLETLPVVVVAALVFIATCFLFLLWLLTRDPGVLRTRFGFYVERERFPRYVSPSDQETHEWPKPGHQSRIE